MNKRYIIFWLSLFCIILSSKAFSQVWTYDCPGGEEYKSPDYEVSIIQGNDTLESFVYYSYGKDSYILYNWKLEPTEPPDYNAHPNHNGPKRFSSSIFSFSDSVIVQVKIKNGANNITLPLKSAKILPSSYNIPCVIKDGNIIEFKLDRPEKVAVIPNYGEAWNVFAQKGVGHIPIESWKNSYGIEKNRESYHGNNLDSYLKEGYQNPLFIFGHAPEKGIPDSTSANTLVVKPGDLVTQSKMNLYKTVWFTPGIHDLSQFGSIPWFQTKIKKGQTFYLEGGAYVKARFKEDNSGYGPSSITGRGTISGIGHLYVRSFEEGSQVISVDSIIGVTITDRACFGIYGGQYIGDIAMVGAWHGNTDGPDYVDNCLIENCFLQAHDDNLKINHNTHARHCVIWQGTNAHAIMVKETFRDKKEGIHLFANSVVEDIDIIGYFPSTDWDNPWPQISKAAISVVTAMDLEIKNLTFKDIRIESPYLARVFNIYNLNTNQINPGWFQPTSESYHTKIDGITFSNISVNSPVICYQSLIGSGYENSLKNISLSKIIINGTEITGDNFNDFLEIECGKVENFAINGDSIQIVCEATRKSYNNQIIQFPGDTLLAWQYDYLEDDSGNKKFALDSAQTIGIYGCNDTTGLNPRSYTDAGQFQDAAQFRWDNNAQTFSKNGQWLEYTINFSQDEPYQLLLQARTDMDANFFLTVFSPGLDTLFSRNVNLVNDFTNLGKANEHTGWLFSKFSTPKLWGKHVVRFNWYDNIGEPGIFGAFSFIKSNLDVTPPAWYFVSVGTMERGTDITVMTTEAAKVYLVPEGTDPDTTSIQNSAVAGFSVTAYSQAKLATSVLPSGNYVVYAIDSSGNISKASKTITLQIPVNAELIKDDSDIVISFNRVNKKINVRSAWELKQIDVYTILGEKIHSEFCDNSWYELSAVDLKKGIYLFKVVDVKGNYKKTKICVL